jgi:hypothetical protein
MRRSNLAFVAAFIAASLFGAAAQAELVAWYSFDGDMTDSSGNGYDAAGGGHYAAGRAGRGQALDISGNAGWYAAAPVCTSPGLASKVTIGAWVYLTSGSAYQTVAQQDGDWARKLVIDDRGVSGDTYAAFAGFNDDGNWDAILEAKPTAGETGKWVFMAATYDNTTSTTKVWADDSTNVDTDSFTRIAQNRESLDIGSIQGSWEALQGQVDDVFVFTGCLTDAQVEAIRDAADPLAEAQAISATMSKWNEDARTTVKMDFQGDGKGDVAEGVAAGWEVWQPVYRFGGSAGASDMVDVEGNNTGWNFSILNGLDGDWNQGGDAAAADYFYTLGTGDSYSPDFEISGLTPGETYRLTPITGQGGSPQFLLPDTNGDGDNYFVDNTEPYISNEILAGQTRSIDCVASASGTIVGEFYFNEWWEGQIGGMVIEELGTDEESLPVSEPAALGLLGFAALAIRRKRS